MEKERFDRISQRQDMSKLFKNKEVGKGGLVCFGVLCAVLLYGSFTMTVLQR